MTREQKDTTREELNKEGGNMNLYRVSALFLGKDLRHEVVSGFIVAEDEEEVFEQLYDKCYWDEWSKRSVEQIKEEKGTYRFPYMGEFYDIKYKWEKIGEIQEGEVEILDRFGVLRTGVAERKYG